MKKFLSLVLFSFLVSLLYAQEKPSDKVKDVGKLKDLLKQNGFHLQKNDKGLVALALDQKPLFLYETDKGKVFVNPIDKMKIFVPAFNCNMPVVKSAPRLYMPNAMLHQNYKPELNLSTPSASPSQK